MVISIIDDASHVYLGENYAKEQQEFQKVRHEWKAVAEKIVAEKNPEKAAVYHSNSETMTCRYVVDGDEHTVIVAFIPSGSIMQREWWYQDKIVENGQGGQTHLRGWILD